MEEIQEYVVIRKIRVRPWTTLFSVFDRSNRKDKRVRASGLADLQSHRTLPIIRFSPQDL